MPIEKQEIKSGEYLRRSQALLQKVERRLGSGEAYKFKISIVQATNRREAGRRAFMILAYTNALMSNYLKGISEVAKPHHAPSIMPLQLNASLCYELNSALASVKKPWFWEKGKSAALRATLAGNYKLAGRTFGGLVRLLREHPELEKAYEERVTAGEMEKWKHKEFRELWEKKAAAESELKRLFLKHVARMAEAPPKKKE